MASGSRPNRAASRGSQRGGEPEEEYVDPVLARQAFIAILSSRDSLMESVERYFVASDNEIEHLRGINHRLATRVLDLQDRVETLTAELNLLRGESSSVPGGSKRPQ